MKIPEHVGPGPHLSWIDLENGKTNEICPGCIWLKTDYNKWASNWRIITT